MPVSYATVVQDPTVSGSCCDYSVKVRAATKC